MATPTTDFYALLMYFPMVIAENFLARTFGSYTLQLFEINETLRFTLPELVELRLTTLDDGYQRLCP